MGITILKEIEALGAEYEIEVGALSFLAERLGLIPILHDMAPVLHHYFPDAPLRLRLERDPETGREMELWALAGWRGADEDWMQPVEALDRFRHDWWFAHSLPVRRHLAVDFEFLGAEQ